MNKLFYIAPMILLIMAALMSCTAAGSSPPESIIVDAEYTSAVSHPIQVESTSVATPEPCPVTGEEIVMLAKTMYAEAQVVYWNGTRWGVSYKARQAAVGWCALNRYDNGAFGDTLTDVLSTPAQFAYSPDAVITDDMLALAQDVVNRWWREKQGATDVGRTLPPDYLYFAGDGRENWFRQEYESTTYWDWSYPDPYVEGGV